MDARAAIAAPARPTGEPPRRPPRGSHLKSQPRLRCITDNPVLRRPLEPGQYTAYDFGQVLDDHNVLASIGSVGDAYDCDDVSAVVLV